MKHNRSVGSYDTVCVYSTDGKQSLNYEVFVKVDVIEYNEHVNHSIVITVKHLLQWMSVCLSEWTDINNNLKFGTIFYFTKSDLVL